MVKRLKVIVVLLFILMPLLQTQALGAISWGTRTGTGFTYGKSYHLLFWLKGGGSWEYLAGCSIDATLDVQNATLICSNPGTNRFDVRSGLGGTVIDVILNLASAPTVEIDERGNFSVESDVIWSERDEIPGDYENRQALFNSQWGVNSEDCKTSGTWNPYSYLVQAAYLSGTLTGTCEGQGTREAFCETKEDPRSWPGDDNKVDYICVDKGNPIAWDDSYSVRKNKTLNVSAPGVKGNDHDTDEDFPTPVDDLVANIVDDLDPSEGDVALNSDGSFTYTPPSPGFTGVVSFTYEVVDTNDKHSNVATVTITVN